MGKYMAVIGGLITIALGALGLMRWWIFFYKGLKATIPAFLILTGLIALMAGISEIKDSAQSKKEEQKK